MQSLDFTLRDLIGRKCRILLQSLFNEGATRAWILRRIGTVIAMALPQAQYVGGNIVNLSRVKWRSGIRLCGVCKKALSAIGVVYFTCAMAVNVGAPVLVPRCDVMCRSLYLI
jgi:hypothetical protein